MAGPCEGRRGEGGGHRSAGPARGQRARRQLRRGTVTATGVPVARRRAALSLLQRNARRPWGGDRAPLRARLQACLFRGGELLPGFLGEGMLPPRQGTVTGVLCPAAPGARSYRCAALCRAPPESWACGGVPALRPPGIPVPVFLPARCPAGRGLQQHSPNQLGS